MTILGLAALAFLVGLARVLDTQGSHEVGQSFTNEPKAVRLLRFCECGHEMAYHGHPGGLAPGCDQCHCRKWREAE
jgi:hypothetical protein